MKTNQGENEPVHIKADEIVHVAATSSPEAELLKGILQQMVANERRRVRNEFIRLMLFSFVILLCAAGAAVWLHRDIIGRDGAAKPSYIPRQKREQLEAEHAAASPSSPAGRMEETEATGGGEKKSSAVQAAGERAHPRPTSPGAADSRLPPNSAPPEPPAHPSYGNTLIIPIKGDIPLRAPIPRP